MIKNSLENLCKDFLHQKELVEIFEKNIKKDFYDKFDECLANHQDKTLKNYTIKKVEKFKTEYDIDKLKEKLNSLEFKSISTKTIQVNDPEGLISFFKRKGITLSDVKKYISVITSIDEPLLNQNLELGKISIDKIKGCLEQKLISRYYIVNRVDKDE